MKIAELLDEAKVSSVLRENPRRVLLSNQWESTWEFEHTKFGDLTPELDAFLSDKCWFDPPPAHGKKDFPFGGSNLRDLRGIWHAHMHFGKVVIIYQIESDAVKLFVAGDHKMVETGGLTDLANAVKRLKKQEWTEVPAPSRPVRDDVEVDSATQAAVDEWIELLSQDQSTIYLLHRFAQDKRNVLPLVSYFALEPNLANVSVEWLQKMVIAFLNKS